MSDKKVTIEINSEAAEVLKLIWAAFENDEWKKPETNSEIVEALIAMFAWFMEEEALSSSEWEHIHGDSCNHD